MSWLEIIGYIAAILVLSKLIDRLFDRYWPTNRKDK